MLFSFAASRRPRILACAAVALLTACASRVPTVEYDGPQPSETALLLLEEMREEEMLDEKGLLGGGWWKLGRYAVLENPASPGGEGPVVVLRRNREVRYIAVERDADVGDLYLRFRGETPSSLPVEPVSAAYRDSWGDDAR